MNKSDLKTGMTVETRNGDQYRVIKDVYTRNYGHQEYIFCDFNFEFMVGSEFNKYLECIDDEEFTIMKVYDKEFPGDILNKRITKPLIWEREPQKTFNIDGIDYSVETLRNIIKKAHK